MLRTTCFIAILALQTAGLLSLPLGAQEPVVSNWKFVSVPDFLNRDTRFPEPRFEEGLSFFLESIKQEEPEFVLIAGDLVNGRWPSKLEPSRDAIISNAAIFYPAWKERFNHHGLKYYATIGDHEIGDNPWPADKAALVPLFKEQFTRYFQFPQNGPDGFKGTSYFFTHNQSLLVALDVFTEGNGREGKIVADVNGEHLRWLDNVLQEHRDAKFKIVMGHTPILGPVKKRNSSGLMFQHGDRSALWQTMKAGKVDLYLCGEVHAITCIEKDGINQIAHGSLFGWNPTANYLLVEIVGDSLKATLKEIDVTPLREEGASVGINITEETRNQGFRTVGTLEISKSGGVVSKQPSGVFSEP